MMPEEWPVAANSAGEAAGARPAGRNRLSTVRSDFFLDPTKRLTEQERALMGAMLHCLVADIADALRAALPTGRLAANDEDNGILVSTLSAAGLLDEPELMALLLRRADEERIATTARVRTGRREARVLQGLVSHDYGAVAAASMALILGRGRRRDRFGQCLLVLDDLSQSTAETLVHTTAAGLRRELAAVRGISGADAELAEAAEKVLGGRDEERGLDTLTASLVDLLSEAGTLTDELVLGAAHEGEVSFVAAVLAQRSGVSSEAAFEELLSGEPGHVMALLRGAAASRALAAGLLAAIGDLVGIDDAGEAISLFDSLTDADVQRARSWLVTEPAYRTAVDRLGQSRG